MTARLAIASYDGPTTNGTSHLVVLDGTLATTACGDGWSARRADTQTLPALITCGRCRFVLDIPRVPIRDAAHLRKLVGQRDAEVSP